MQYLHIQETNKIVFSRDVSVDFISLVVRVRHDLRQHDNERTFTFQLLKPDPDGRLSASRIKTHPFFKGIDWEAVKARRDDPPFSPV